MPGNTPTNNNNNIKKEKDILDYKIKQNKSSLLALTSSFYPKRGTKTINYDTCFFPCFFFKHFLFCFFKSNLLPYLLLPQSLPWPIPHNLQFHPQKHEYVHYLFHVK